MNKTWIRNVLQSIAKHKGYWIGIALTALLGTLLILGMNGTSRAVRRSVNDYYAGQEHRDAEVAADLLLSPEDLEVIRRTEGVKDAEPLWQTIAGTGEGETKMEVQVLSLTERISLPALMEGRLPQDGTECAVEEALSEKMGWQVGDRISLLGEEGEAPQYLTGGEFVIVGIAGHPGHAWSDDRQDGCVLVTAGAFDQEALDGCAMKAEILAEKEVGIDRFSEGYRGIAEAVSSRIEELAPERLALREQVVREKAQAEIDEGRKQLDDAWKSLETSRADLDRKWSDLKAEEQRLAEEQGKLPAAEAQLNAEKARLEEQQKELEKTRTELEAAKKQLEEPGKQLEEARAKLDADKKKLDKEKSKLDETADELAVEKKKLANSFASLEEEKAGIRSAIRKVIDNAYGGSTGELIDWASKSKPDVNDEGVTAEELRITGSFKAGTSKTWSQVIEGFVYSSAIPDEVLVRIYRNMKDDPHAEPDLKEVREFLSRQAIDHSKDVRARYESLQPDCIKWDESHKGYLTARSDYKKSQSSYQEKLKEYDTAAAAQTAAEEEHKKALDGITAEEQKLAEAEKAAEESRTAYEAALAQHEADVKTVEEGKKALEDSRTALNEEEAGYSRDQAACEAEEARLEEAKKQLENMPAGTWKVSDAAQEAGLVQARKTGERLKGFTVVAAMLMPLVLAAAVYLLTSRMMLEQRDLARNTRVTKEYKQEVWTGHLAFGASAVLAGTILGILLARFAVEPALLGGIAGRYAFDMKPAGPGAAAVILVLLAGLLIAGVMVSIACLRPMQKTKGKARGKAGEPKTETEEKDH